jgi:hypothetical protein
MTQTVALGPGAGLSRRMKLLLALILTRQFTAVLDACIVNVAMPTIRRDLRASGSDVQLIVAGCWALRRGQQSADLVPREVGHRFAIVQAPVRPSLRPPCSPSR